MDDLKTLLDHLEDNRLDYVMERSRCNTDAEAYRSASISKATFYSWPAEEREKLNELAQKLKRASALKAYLILSEATEKAAQVKVKALDSRKDTVQQAAATEILDRSLGKPAQRQEITGKDGGPVATRVIEVKYTDDGEDGSQD